MDHHLYLKGSAKHEDRVFTSPTEKELEARGLTVGRGPEHATHTAFNLKRLVLAFVIAIAVLATFAYGLAQRSQISCLNHKITGSQLLTGPASTPLKDTGTYPEWKFAAYNDIYCQTTPVTTSKGSAPRTCTPMGSDSVKNLDFFGDETYTLCLYTKDSCKRYVGMYPGLAKPFKCRPDYYAASYRVINQTENPVCPGNKEPCDPSECEARYPGCKCDPWGSICRCP
jgi:hypothetical protein